MSKLSTEETATPYKSTNDLNTNRPPLGDDSSRCTTSTHVILAQQDWTIQEVKSAVTMKITNGHHSKVVHVNVLRHRIQKQPEEIEEPQANGEAPWVPPEIEHLIIPSDPPERHYPL